MRRSNFLLRSQDAVTRSPKRYYSNKGESEAVAYCLTTSTKSINSNKRYGGKFIRFAPKPVDPPSEKEGEYVPNDKRGYHENVPDFLRINTRFDSTYSVDEKGKN